MHLAAIQFDIAWEDADANFEKVRALLKSSPPPPGSLVALPEMFTSGFSMNVAAITPDYGRVVEKFCRETAERFKVALVAGLPVRSGAACKNEALVVGPSGDILGRYHKIHPYAQERNHYVAGTGIVTFAYGDFTVAPFICYDLRFPESFRAAAARGANVIVVIASWPAPRIEHWVTLARARAIENQSYVLAVNRVGDDPNNQHPGRSLIVDFRGNVLADAGGEETIITAPTDVGALRAYRREFPFLADMK
jgi:predicted amidohydrolase